MKNCKLVAIVLVLLSVLLWLFFFFVQSTEVGVDKATEVLYVKYQGENISFTEFEQEILELLASSQITQTLQRHRPYSRAGVMWEIGIKTKWSPIHFVLGEDSFAYSGIRTWKIKDSKYIITFLEKTIQ